MSTLLLILNLPKDDLGARRIKCYSSGGWTQQRFISDSISWVVADDEEWEVEYEKVHALICAARRARGE